MPTISQTCVHKCEVLIYTTEKIFFYLRVNPIYTLYIHTYIERVYICFFFYYSSSRIL